MDTKNSKNSRNPDFSQGQLSDLQVLPLIMDHIPQAIFWKDRDLVYLGCNQAFAEDAGLDSPEQIVGKTDFDMPWKDQAELYRADDRLVMDNGESKLNYEEPQTSPDGSTIWLNTSKIPIYENGQVVAVLGMYEDITARKQVEEENERGRQRFEMILETTRIPTIISRLSDGIVLYANQALAQVSQVNLDKLIGFKTGNFYANPDDRKTVLESLRQHGHIDDFEVQLQRTDGSRYWVLLSSRITELEGESCVLSTYMDITERKRVDQTLWESQRLLQLVMDNIPQAVFWKDKDLVYLGANQAFAEDAGYESPQDLIGKTDSDMPWQEQAELYRADDQKVMDEGVPKLNYEEPQTGPTGEVTWLRTSKIPMVNDTGDVFAVLGMYEDITANKEAEAEVRETQQLLQGFLDNFPDGAWVKDLNGHFILVNRYMYETIYDTTAEAILGKTVHDLLSKELADFLWESEKRLIETGEIFSVEESIPQADGKTYDKVTTKFPLYDTEGNITGLGGVLFDITERKRLDAQVQEAFERRGYQVQVSTEISQQISQATELSELFERVVTLTKEQLGYYHTQLLRYDPSQDAVVLAAGYGETGQKMFDLGHHMPMGSGLIGTAAATGETVMRSELAQDPDWEPNPLLPDTQGEIAIPIKLGDEILGVLDVQSSQAGALSEDDRLLLEGLCGQIAIAMEQTRLRQEMEERLQEINNLYRVMSHEGWQTYRETANLPDGFIYDQITIRPVEETGLAKGFFANAPMVLPGGETLGELSLADDPDKPLSEEDRAFLQQVSEQVALALESARLSEQTQIALAQSERLFDASRSLTQSADLQELVAATVKTLAIPVVNRGILATFEYGSENEVEKLTVVANWWNGEGHEVTPVGTRYSKEVIRLMPMFVSSKPVFFDDAFTDERVDETTMELVKRQNLRAVAVLPLHLGSDQIGALILEAEDPHNFTPDETRLFESLAPQIATVLENRQQYENAQRQAEREAMLNTINQKIQSATSVEAVLQIAARELGHALGAPMTIAQLSMQEKN